MFCTFRLVSGATPVHLGLCTVCTVHVKDRDMSTRRMHTWVVILVILVGSVATYLPPQCYKCGDAWGSGTPYCAQDTLQRVSLPGWSSSLIAGLPSLTLLSSTTRISYVHVGVALPTWAAVSPAIVESHLFSVIACGDRSPRATALSSLASAVSGTMGVLVPLETLAIAPTPDTPTVSGMAASALARCASTSGCTGVWVGPTVAVGHTEACAGVVRVQAVLFGLPGVPSGFQRHPVVLVGVNVTRSPLSWLHAPSVLIGLCQSGATVCDPVSSAGSTRCLATSPTTATALSQGGNCVCGTGGRVPTPCSSVVVTAHRGWTATPIPGRWRLLLVVPLVWAFPVGVGPWGTADVLLDLEIPDTTHRAVFRRACEIAGLAGDCATIAPTRLWWLFGGRTSASADAPAAFASALSNTLETLVREACTGTTCSTVVFRDEGVVSHTWEGVTRDVAVVSLWGTGGTVVPLQVTPSTCGNATNTLFCRVPRTGVVTLRGADDCVLTDDSSVTPVFSEDPPVVVGTTTGPLRTSVTGVAFGVKPPSGVSVHTEELTVYSVVGAWLPVAVLLHTLLGSANATWLLDCTACVDVNVNVSSAILERYAVYDADISGLWWFPTTKVAGSVGYSSIAAVVFRVFVSRRGDTPLVERLGDTADTGQVSVHVGAQSPVFVPQSSAFEGTPSLLSITSGFARLCVASAHVCAALAPRRGVHFLGAARDSLGVGWLATNCTFSATWGFDPLCAPTGGVPPPSVAPSASPVPSVGADTGGLALLDNALVSVSHRDFAASVGIWCVTVVCTITADGLLTEPCVCSCGIERVEVTLPTGSVVCGACSLEMDVVGGDCVAPATDKCGLPGTVAVRRPSNDANQTRCVCNEGYTGQTCERCLPINGTEAVFDGVACLPVDEYCGEFGLWSPVTRACTCTHHRGGSRCDDVLYEACPDGQIPANSSDTEAWCRCADPTLAHPLTGHCRRCPWPLLLETDGVTCVETCARGETAESATTGYCDYYCTTGACSEDGCPMETVLVDGACVACTAICGPAYAVCANTTAACRCHQGGGEPPCGTASCSPRNLLQGDCLSCEAVCLVTGGLCNSTECVCPTGHTFYSDVGCVGCPVGTALNATTGRCDPCLHCVTAPGRGACITGGDQCVCAPGFDPAHGCLQCLPDHRQVGDQCVACGGFGAMCGPLGVCVDDGCVCVEGAVNVCPPGGDIPTTPGAVCCVPCKDPASCLGQGMCVGGCPSGMVCVGRGSATYECVCGPGLVYAPAAAMCVPEFPREVRSGVATKVVCDSGASANRRFFLGAILVCLLLVLQFLTGLFSVLIAGRPVS